MVLPLICLANMFITLWVQETGARLRRFAFYSVGTHALESQERCRFTTRAETLRSTCGGKDLIRSPCQHLHSCSRRTWVYLTTTLKDFYLFSEHTFVIYVERYSLTLAGALPGDSCSLPVRCYWAETATKPGATVRAHGGRRQTGDGRDPLDYISLPGQTFCRVRNWQELRKWPRLRGGQGVPICKRSLTMPLPETACWTAGSCCN
jgi:hypothetical protein